MAYRSSFEPILDAVGSYGYPLQAWTMAEVSSLIWRPVLSRDRMACSGHDRWLLGACTGMLTQRNLADGVAMS